MSVRGVTLICKHFYPCQGDYDAKVKETADKGGASDPTGGPDTDSASSAGNRAANGANGAGSGAGSSSHNGVGNDYAPFETMRYDPATNEPGSLVPGFVRLARHLARWDRSCAWLGFDPAHDKVVAALRKAVAGLDKAHRVRMTLGPSGTIEVTFTPLSHERFNDTPQDAVAAAARVVAEGGELGRAALAQQRVDETDPARAHKTTARELYYAARSYAEEHGLDDVLFLDSRGKLAEGSIASVFLVSAEHGVADVATPPLSSGVLPGVLREELIERGLVQVRDLGELDLRRAAAVLLGSSVRGLRQVVLQAEPVKIG